MHKAGFVNIVGNPNVGKSTLMNALVGERISIATFKAQTTRHRIMGIYNTDDMQIVFSDTPGVLKPTYKLQESMLNFSTSALTDADVLLYVTDVVETPDKHNDFVEKVSRMEVPVLLLVNKIDLSNQEKLVELVEAWKELLPNAEIIPISAATKFNVDYVMKRIKELLPDSPPYFDKDQWTDKPARFFVNEIIREKILLYYDKEIPYSVEVVVEQFKEEEKKIHINAVIYVERDSQKGIIIGKQGKALKKVATEARREYQTWEATADTSFKSLYNGNQAVDVLEARPEMVILWAGYAFSKDYSTPRGHMYAIEDMRNTLRVGAPMTENEGPQPATCWTCKSPDVPRMMQAMGVDNFYKGKWASLGKEIVNPIGCADCHEPENMNLHISRPALIEAFQRQGKDITKATQQEMRSLVCAQCHVEYYFKGDGKYLTFPWDKGSTVEDMEAYYDEAGFSDYTHKLSRAPILKAQHPDYEISQMGIHAQRGVSCADCHMPYKSEGGVKYSDHHIQSPLAMIDRTCQVCHRESEETLRNNVYERQNKANEMRNRLETELAKAHIEAKFAWDKGATEDQMKDVLKLIRQAQWRWDFGVASHGGAFHAPQEIQRILGNGLDKAMQARLATAKVLAKLGYTDDVPMPDFSTKEKAQQYIGLDMAAERTAKEKFLNTIVPQWVKEAQENNRLAKNI